MGKILNTSQLTSKYILPDQSQHENSIQSNTSSTENMTTSFVKQRTSAKNYGQPKEEILQTLTLTNNSELEISAVLIVDVIGRGATFKEGSLQIDGEAKANLSPIVGFQLPKNLQPNDTVVVTYTIIIADEPTTDLVNLISNITYTAGDVEELKEKSNIVRILISIEGLTITKTADKDAVIKGDKIKFTNVIKNGGNTDNTDIFFKDPLPEGVAFVNGSVIVDGESKPDANPETGFNIKDLQPGDESTVIFEVTVE